MSARRYLAISVLSACLVAPVLIGASCPPPSSPIFISVRTSSPTICTAGVLPRCDSGFVCVSIVNQACIDADVVLYVHDGHDPQGIYPAGESIRCCPNPDIATDPCPCKRPGAEIGEMQLLWPELFQPRHRTTIAGLMPFVLPAGESIMEKIQCEKIKSMGIEVGRAGTLPASYEYRAGVHYRCAEQPVPVPDYIDWVLLEEQVPCGETIQYVIYDLNDCADPALTQFSAAWCVSMDCAEAVVEQAEDAATDQQ